MTESKKLKVTLTADKVIVDRYEYDRNSKVLTRKGNVKSHFMPRHVEGVVQYAESIAATEPTLSAELLALTVKPEVSTRQTVTKAKVSKVGAKKVSSGKVKIIASQEVQANSETVVEEAEKVETPIEAVSEIETPANPIAKNKFRKSI